MLQNLISSHSHQTLSGRDNVLAIMCFKGCGERELITAMQTTRLELLGQSEASQALEIWQIEGAEQVESGQAGACVWRRTNNLQMCGYSDDLMSEKDIEQATYQAYSALLEFIVDSPHPELVRFWNYLPNINHGAGDAENYKRFCNGRLQAFTEFKLDDLQFPAASAVGHYQQGLTVTALTAASAVRHYANPRQVDAFKYPRQYGPSSPSFARATTVTINERDFCFISGTASILGHSSVHKEDLKLQLYTTNDNILYLLKETGFKRNQIGTLRVYLRNQSDLAECQQVLAELFPDTTIIYLHADICRSDLLVEIECFCVAD